MAAHQPSVGSQVSGTPHRQIQREVTVAGLAISQGRGQAGCPMTSNFPFCQLVVLDWRRLPLNFPRPAADSLLVDTFMQPGNLPKRSPKHPDRQTSMSRVAALQPTKRANRTLYRPKIQVFSAGLNRSHVA
jgi:hypothetical protein